MARFLVSDLSISLSQASVRALSQCVMVLSSSTSILLSFEGEDILSLPEISIIMRMNSANLLSSFFVRVHLSYELVLSISCNRYWELRILFEKLVGVFSLNSMNLSAIAPSLFWVWLNTEITASIKLCWSILTPKSPSRSSSNLFTALTLSLLSFVICRESSSSRITEILSLPAPSSMTVALLQTLLIFTWIN